ncbi:hypothetical protein BTJ68_12885 [Hortaea werneckii EXF-2000]|uniref:Filamentation protein n=2 Tax=Hortaea werneckii TaxID=91943 RepID=A0A3M7J8H7_HORWE|nr:hypothetical protein BTJ68_12885 [Hortaea werneckii EXF-2000]RMZ34107.1 hypothetical protein D0859_01757 [Hortaea werneckii]
MNVAGKALGTEKGRRYLAQLDQALCDGKWAEVAELARKTEKHAPEKHCYTLTARTEAQIASASRRPASASSNDTTSIHGLSGAIPKLQEATAASSSGPEDVYCARTCLAEIHWLQEDPSAALKALPEGETPAGGNDRNAPPLGWPEVCSTRSAFLRAAASEGLGNDQEARGVYRDAARNVPGSRSAELRKWTERLLARASIHASKATTQPTLANLNESLSIFRAWASFWQRASPPASGGSTSQRVDVPRRQVWRAYYELLSSILQHGLLYNPNAAADAQSLLVPWSEAKPEQYTEAKVRQRAELKRVEATYKSLLVQETQFPKANESNTEVEEWVEQAVENWKILCGGLWTDSELGEGGKEAVGRSILDILYRAATKTFHSTAILRQLFTVHAAIGEFDLAIHAFDSYVEIVSKGKARGEKTGKHELGFDTDDSAIQTAAEAVRILCKYGDREQAEKALDVSETIKQWLYQQRPTAEQELETAEEKKLDGPDQLRQPTLKQLTLESLAAANFAIGLAHAHWARLSFEDEKRGDSYTEALNHLKKSLAFNDRSVETAYTLARVLAETQDVSSAVDIIRRSIAVSHTADDAFTDTNSFATADESGYHVDEDDEDDWDRQRQLIPLWHLLALCLSAKDDYEPAFNACEAAFEQFGDPNVLWGRAGSKARSTNQTRAMRGLVDQMDNFEREAILEIKMTELAFLELTEGVERAVEASNELLVSYTRLFGSPSQLKSPLKAPQPVINTPSKHGGGALRSVVGSIRPRSARNSGENTLREPSPSRPTSANTQRDGSPIAITITNENGTSAEKQQHSHHHHLHVPFKTRGHHGDFTEAGSLRSKRSREDLKERQGSDMDEKPLSTSPQDGADVANPDHPAANPPAVKPALSDSMSREEPRQPLKEPEHNAPHDAWPAPTGHVHPPLEQDMRLPAPHPASNAMPMPTFGSMQERQFKVTVLSKVWLFIASMYIRAGMFEDANGAVQDAMVLVEVLEGDKCAEGANARGLFERGWGGGKSVDRLWADVFAVKGQLAVAQVQSFSAMVHYEDALLHFPDHPEAIIGISNLLMDIYEEKMPVEEPQLLLPPLPASSGSLVNDPTLLHRPEGETPTTAKSTLANTGRALPPSVTRNNDPSPAELNRLAARDRAYMLLANLTRLGSGWDDAEAWLTLARAHELSKDIAKAKKALWWVVELEDASPVRSWVDVTAGGYAL